MTRLEETRIIGRGDGKAMFIPPMEPYGARLAAAAFRAAGYDARVLREDASTLALGLKHTGGGECVPCPTTTGALLAAMEEERRPPEQVIFFMPTACGPCRFGQYSVLDRLIFEKLGYGGIKIMSPSAENAYEGVSTDTRMRMWHALVAGDVLRKIAQKTRPYETTKGATDELVEDAVRRLEDVFAGPSIKSAKNVVAEAAERAKALPKRNERRPLVGVVGEIYVRCNPFINNDLCRRIEELGGESWLAPVAEWLLYTNHLRVFLLSEQPFGPRRLVERLRVWMETHFFFERVEHSYYDAADAVLHDRREHPIADVMAEGMKYLPWQFEGEAGLTLGRAALFASRDGAKAVVNASPMFCMPGTITTSIFPRLEREYGIPMVSTFYDGSGDPNASLGPLMHYLANDPKMAERAASVRRSRRYSATDVPARASAE